jgi:uncharacterized protein YifE (UPF0438 family)
VDVTQPRALDGGTNSPRASLTRSATMPSSSEALASANHQVASIPASSKSGTVQNRKSGDDTNTEDEDGTDVLDVIQKEREKIDEEEKKKEAYKVATDKNKTSDLEPEEEDVDVLAIIQKEREKIENEEKNTMAYKDMIDKKKRTTLENVAEAEEEHDYIHSEARNDSDDDCEEDETCDIVTDLVGQNSVLGRRMNSSNLIDNPPLQRRVSPQGGNPNTTHQSTAHDNALLPSNPSSSFRAAYGDDDDGDDKSIDEDDLIAELAEQSISNFVQACNASLAGLPIAATVVPSEEDLEGAIRQRLETELRHHFKREMSAFRRQVLSASIAAQQQQHNLHSSNNRNLPAIVQVAAPITDAHVIVQPPSTGIGNWPSAGSYGRSSIESMHERSTHARDNEDEVRGFRDISLE